MDNQDLLLDFHVANDSLRDLSTSPFWKSEEKKSYHLSRGKLAVFNETHLSKMQQLLREGKFSVLKAAIAETKLSHDFTGTFYSVFFKVNKPIVLKSFGFWGPFTEESARYHVQVIVSKIGPHIPAPFDSSINGTVLDKSSNFTTGIKKEIFDVPIPQQIELLENTWYQIRFQLNGPETGICSSTKSYYSCKESGVDFEFFDSSFQLPRITFSLPENSY